MGNQATKSATKEQNKLDCMERLQLACSTSTIPTISAHCIKMEKVVAAHCTDVRVTSQNPHIILRIAKYYKELTKSEVEDYKNVSSGIEELVYSIVLVNAALKNKLGDDWGLIFIDFMKQKHPNYKLQTCGYKTHKHANIQTSYETLYFVPISGYNNNDDDAKQNDNNVNDT
eukprot:189057_1